MTSILAPIAPHLAEEIYYYEQGGKGDKGDGLSVFSRTWKQLVGGISICHITLS